MTDFDALIERLEKGVGPDRGLDGRIALWLGWGCHYDFGDNPERDEDFNDWPDWAGHWLPPGVADLSHPHKCRCTSERYMADPPTYTDSLDACFALFDEVMPECLSHIERFHDADLWHVTGHVKGEGAVIGAHAELPRAILIAIVEAKKAGG